MSDSDTQPENSHKAQELFTSYRSDYDATHSKWVRAADRQDKFFQGDQWSEEDVAKLDKQGRPHLTINLIKPSITSISGEQRANRGEFNFKPRDNEADAHTAEILTRLALHVQDENNYDYLESQVFDDGIIEDRGFLDVRVDFTDNIHGDIRIRADDPRNIILDPDAKEYDPDTWNRVTETYWLSMDEIRARYGKDKAENVKAHVHQHVVGGSGLDIDDVIFDQNRFGDSELTQIQAPGSEQAKYIKSVRIVERQQKRFTNSRVFIDLKSGDIKDIPESMSDERIEHILSTVESLSTTKKMRSRIRWTVAVLGGIILHDDWSPYPFLTKVPFFPYFRRGRPLGVVRDLTSPQEQLNKVESQELHVVNTTANSGWVVEDGSIVNMSDNELEARGAETGLVLRYRRGAQAPDKITPNQVPTGLDRKSAKTVDYMHKMSVNTSFLGQDNAEVSGVVISQNKQSALLQLRPAFDNLEYTRKFVAKRVLWMIQNFYTNERIVRVTDYKKPERPDSFMAINEVDEYGEILNDVTLGDYDVIVSSAPARDSRNDTEFAQLMQLAEAQIMIPPQELILRSNISNKFELADQVAQMAGTAPPTEEQQKQQQAAQQLEFAKMQGEVQKLQSQAQEMMTRAQLNEAKVQEAMRAAEPDPIEVQRLQQEREQYQLDFRAEMAKIQASMEEAIRGFENKVEIAQMQVGAKEEQMRHDTVLQTRKLASEAAKSKPTETKE